MFSSNKKTLTVSNEHMQTKIYSSTFSRFNGQKSYAIDYFYHKTRSIMLGNRNNNFRFCSKQSISIFKKQLPKFSFVL